MPSRRHSADLRGRRQDSWASAFAIWRLALGSNWVDFGSSHGRWHRNGRGSGLLDADSGPQRAIEGWSAGGKASHQLKSASAGLQFRIRH